MSRREYLTNAELQDIIDNWSDDEHDHQDERASAIEAVICLPPNNTAGDSDCETIDDEKISTNITCDESPLNEIAGNVLHCVLFVLLVICVLLGTIEVIYTSTIDDYGGLENEVHQEESQPSTSKELPKHKYRPITDFKPVWKKTKRTAYDIHPVHEPLIKKKQELLLRAIREKQPFELFKLFFDDDVIASLVDETNRYAAQNNINKICDKYLLQRFMGILLFSGYHSVPQTTLYWSLDPAFGIPMIRQTMSRNTFTKLKKNFHIANNDNLDISDKFSKIRPLFDMLNKRYLQFGVFVEHLSIDETMVPYFGRHSAKMFIRGKPIRFGYKLWALCSNNGYMFQFIPYAGASGIYNKSLGLGASIVMELLSHCEHPVQHTVHFDNFFTSHYLLCLLKEKGFCATGTVRPNRIAGAPLKTGKKALKKHDTDYVYDIRNNVMVIRWMDNSEVTIATNYDTIDPMATVQRYSKEKKKKVGVQQPLAFNNYNKHMGGVDLHDNGVSNYRVGIRGKKWWWPLWVQCLDSAVVNAWKLHCFEATSKNAKPMSQLDFKNSVTKSLLLSSEDTMDRIEVSSTEDSDTDYRQQNLPRIDGLHVPLKSTNRRRCIVCTPRATIFKCEKCNVHLHSENCFKLFHEDKQFYLQRRATRSNKKPRIE